MTFLNKNNTASITLAFAAAMPVSGCMKAQRVTIPSTAAMAHITPEAEAVIVCDEYKNFYSETLKSTLPVYVEGQEFNLPAVVTVGNDAIVIAGASQREILMTHSFDKCLFDGDPVRVDLLCGNGGGFQNVPLSDIRLAPNFNIQPVYILDENGRQAEKVPVQNREECLLRVSHTR